MHMADALISPAIGTAFLGISAGVGAWSVHRLRQEQNHERVPLMGVMGAFVFTAQMINFSIPGTGSSGHLGGGLLLAAVLGPHAAFLTISAVLLVQALLFGDGGLLALGCNIFNLGVFPCYMAWPLIFKPMMGDSAAPGRVLSGALIGALAALQAGAFSVVLQTVLSGRTLLPFGTFVLLMQPIHLAIGFVEGLVTAAVVQFMLQHRPDTLQGLSRVPEATPLKGKRFAVTMLVITLVTGTLLSSFASGDPDGLEWSIFHATGLEALEAEGPAYTLAASLQELTALMPDYGFKEPSAAATGPIDPGTAASGLVGGIVTLLLLSAFGFALLAMRRRSQNRELL